MSDSSDNDEIFGNDLVEDEEGIEQREREEADEPQPQYT